MRRGPGAPRRFVEHAFDHFARVPQLGVPAKPGAHMHTWARGAERARVPLAARSANGSMDLSGVKSTAGQLTFMTWPCPRRRRGAQPPSKATGADLGTPFFTSN
jgi:hypothetical protein